MPDTDEDDLFAEQEPEPLPSARAELCIDCRLPMDKKHTPERCADWAAWRREYRWKFESMQWS